MSNTPICHLRARQGLLGTTQSRTPFQRLWWSTSIRWIQKATPATLTRTKRTTRIFWIRTRSRIWRWEIKHLLHKEATSPTEWFSAHKTTELLMVPSTWTLSRYKKARAFSTCKMCLNQTRTLRYTKTTRLKLIWTKLGELRGMKRLRIKFWKTPGSKSKCCSISIDRARQEGLELSLNHCKLMTINSSSNGSNLRRGNL